MVRTSLKDTSIKPYLYGKVRAFALGSMYRMNASTADIYTFEVDLDGKSWSGGWSWSNEPKTWDGKYCVRLSDGKLYRLSAGN